MTNSKASLEIYNLVAVAEHHREHCHSPHCNVSLGLLKETAKTLLILCWVSEVEVLTKLINNTDWM